ncbi:hypothetical protein MCBRY_003540 [Methylocystis bryophila]
MAIAQRQAPSQSDIVTLRSFDATRLRKAARGPHARNSRRHIDPARLLCARTLCVWTQAPEGRGADQQEKAGACEKAGQKPNSLAASALDAPLVARLHSGRASLPRTPPASVSERLRRLLLLIWARRICASLWKIQHCSTYAPLASTLRACRAGRFQECDAKDREPVFRAHFALKLWSRSRILRSGDSA